MTAPSTKHPWINLAAHHGYAHNSAESPVFGSWVFLMSDLIIFGLLFETYVTMLNPMSYAGGTTPKDVLNLSSAFAQTMLLLVRLANPLLLVPSEQVGSLPWPPCCCCVVAERIRSWSLIRWTTWMRWTTHLMTKQNWVSMKPGSMNTTRSLALRARPHWAFLVAVSRRSGSRVRSALPRFA